MIGKYKPNAMKRPRGGWKMIVDGIEFESDGHDGLVELIRSYRKDNRIDEGNPDREVEQYICENNSWMCHWYESEQEEKEKPPKHFLAKWIDRIYTKVIVFCPNLRAKHREKCCGECKHNIQVDMSSDYERDVFILTRGDVRNLGYCDIFSWDNRLAVLIEEPDTDDSRSACILPVRNGCGSVFLEWRLDIG